MPAAPCFLFNRTGHLLKWHPFGRHFVPSERGLESGAPALGSLCAGARAAGFRTFADGFFTRDQSGDLD
jgi:hypothetical protein